MNIFTPTSAHTPTHDDSGTIVPADMLRLIEQLDALQPGKQQQKTAQFQKLYSAIERALARNVPQKTVVAQLANMGLPLSIGGFRSLLEAERKQRNERGEYVHCEHCGSVLLGGGETPNPVGSISMASLISKDVIRERTV